MCAHVRVCTRAWVCGGARVRVCTCVPVCVGARVPACTAGSVSRAGAALRRSAGSERVCRCLPAHPCCPASARTPEAAGKNINNHRYGSLLYLGLYFMQLDGHFSSGSRNGSR